MVKSRNFDN